MGKSKDNKGPLPTSFWLDAETRKILDRASRQLGISRSAVVRDALDTMNNSDAQMSTVKLRTIKRLVEELSRVVNSDEETKKSEGG